jgi:hypothetical protein
MRKLATVAAVTAVTVAKAAAREPLFQLMCSSPSSRFFVGEKICAFPHSRLF